MFFEIFICKMHFFVYCASYFIIPTRKIRKFMIKNQRWMEPILFFYILCIVLAKTCVNILFAFEIFVTFKTKVVVNICNSFTTLRYIFNSIIDEWMIFFFCPKILIVQKQKHQKTKGFKNFMVTIKDLKFYKTFLTHACNFFFNFVNCNPFSQV